MDRALSGRALWSAIIGWPAARMIRVRMPSGSAEPSVTSWRPIPVDQFISELPRHEDGQPTVIAVDGRSGSGKSTLTGKLEAALDGAVVHTDDVAWYFSMFDWAAEMADHIIMPVRHRQAVDYQPPGWAPNGRSGSIVLPAAIDTLIIEGVGAGQRALTDLVDVLIWVQCDCDTARTLGISRDVELGHHGGEEEATSFWDQWAADELPFLEAQQPWNRADFIVAGTGSASADPKQVVVRA